MADDLKNGGPQDRSRISLAEDWEVRWWTKELGVSVDRLKELVAQHGNSTEKVRQAAK
jgi:hypothetical protein